MRQKKTVIIGATSYELTQLGATAGASLYHALVRAVGPTLRAKLDDLPTLLALEAGKSEEAHSAILLGLFIEVLEAVPPELMQRLQTTFGEATVATINGVPIGLLAVFDEHFAGAYHELVKWLLESIKFNFLNFLGSKASAAPSA